MEVLYLNSKVFKAFMNTKDECIKHDKRKKEKKNKFKEVKSTQKNLRQRRENKNLNIHQFYSKNLSEQQKAPSPKLLKSPFLQQLSASVTFKHLSCTSTSFWHQTILVKESQSIKMTMFKQSSKISSLEGNLIWTLKKNSCQYFRRRFKV